MKKIKAFLSLFLVIAFVTSVGASIAVQYNAPAVVGSIVSVALLFVALRYPQSVHMGGVSRAGIQVEIWTQDIIDNLYKNNAFALRATSHDSFVTNGKIVHIPRPGAPSQIKKNLTSFPQIATKRTDDDILYALDTYYALPKHIEKIEQYELSYDKRQSVVGEDQAALIQAAMEGLLIRWAPSQATVVETSGANAPASVPGATGNRLSFTKTEFNPIKLAMDVANIPPDGRVALLTAHHHQQFLNSLSDAERTGFHALADMANGIVGRYLGFDIMMRSSVLRYRQVGGIWVPVDEQDEDYEADTEDSAASLFWHPMAVCRARGEVNMFDNPNDAQYYGDVTSMNMRLGGRLLRATGVYAAVEKAAGA